MAIHKNSRLRLVAPCDVLGIEYTKEIKYSIRT